MDEKKAYCFICNLHAARLEYNIALFSIASLYFTLAREYFFWTKSAFPSFLRISAGESDIVTVVIGRISLGLAFHRYPGLCGDK